jgi:hypothetical protein
MTQHRKQSAQELPNFDPLTTRVLFPLGKPQLTPS